MSLFTQLPVSSESPVDTKLNGANVRFLGELEYDAYGHWILGYGDGSLTSATNSKAITPQSEDTLLQYPDQGILTDAVPGRALISDRFESAQDEFTVIAVISPNQTSPSSNKPTPVFGNDYRRAVQLNAGTGYRMQWSDGSWYPVYGDQQSLIEVQPYEWIFACLSVKTDVDAETKSLRTATGINGSLTYEQVFTDDRYDDGVSPMSIGLGNTGNIYTIYGFEFLAQEFIIFNGYKTEEEIQELYLRSQKRMARRGITI